MKNHFMCTSMEERLGNKSRYRAPKVCAGHCSVNNIQCIIQSLYSFISMHVRGDADKSLARPGRKQATVTKLKIYSTYSPQSSIHFIARCCNFCKPCKKKFRRSSVQLGLHGSNGLCVRRPFNCFFSPGNSWQSDGARFRV